MSYSQAPPVALSSHVAGLAQKGVFPAPAVGRLPTISVQQASSGLKYSFKGGENGKQCWHSQEAAELVGLTRGLCLRYMHKGHS